MIAEQILITSRIEDDHFVQAVRNSRIERPLHLSSPCLHGFRTGSRCRPWKPIPVRFWQLARAEIRRHDNDRYSEIHGIAQKPSDKLSVFED